jgi:hypothetical protein
MLCHIRICNHSCEGNESKSTIQDKWASRVSLLPPPPSSVGRVGGGGGGWRGRSCLGILSGEGGFSGKQKPRVEVAPIFGE